MSSLFSSFLGVFVYILIGYILKKINIISNKIEKIISITSFNILLPVALITNFWLITFPDISERKEKNLYKGNIIRIHCGLADIKDLKADMDIALKSLDNK